MSEGRSSSRAGSGWPALCVVGVALLLVDCGGSSTGTTSASGANKTTLTVAATDADGDDLQYQWRVTAGSIDNRNANSTVWTMPDGPGLHFAYVTVSDGKGGYTQQQYSVSSDALGTTAATRAPVPYVAAAVADAGGNASRLRLLSADATTFTPPGGGTASSRAVYLSDRPVQVLQQGTRTVVFSGQSDLSGEVDLPRLPAGQSYDVECASSSSVAMASCGSFVTGPAATVTPMAVPLPDARNLRLYGHVAEADGSVCGTRDEFFQIQAAATVQVIQADGTALTDALRVNRFGDYAIDAAVPVQAALKLKIHCESWQETLDIPASPDPAGYVGGHPIELSRQIPNSRPVIVKMVANGQDGNVRGAMVVPEAGVVSNSLPGALQFLSYKGGDTRLSACMYYRALGAVAACDAQGAPSGAISFDDWKRAKQFTPYNRGNAEVSATYVNRMDLNLVRRMTASRIGPDDIAFYVCNHPGPRGTSQAEVDDVIGSGLANQKQVACVAMEWSASPGVNGGLPYTKFFTFGPDGALRLSINLDTRGEKYMPTACVACHGGTRHNGRFPESGQASAFLGSGFLPFDTGNYLFASASSLTEAAQSQAFHDLNQLVRATETSDTTATSQLVQGWYAGGTTTLNKAWVPPVWQAADAVAATAGAATFYRQVVGASCRTCHASLGPAFDWDAIVLTPARASSHVCGGTADLANNASMPNALISRDRVMQRVQADPALAALMTNFLGCSAPLPDPVYPNR
jgi:mono/diheme cytochrome c family protein